MPTDNALPFAFYPIRDASFVANLGSTVVVAPHPDDEALGCGGLISLLHQAGLPIAAVLVSDGSMSHPASELFSAVARQAVREAEFRHALTLLGADAQEPLLLGLPDGQVPATPEEAGFTEAASQLREFLEQHRTATVVMPWRRDPHPDYRASSQLVQAALIGMHNPPRLLEYVVWAWARAAPADLPTEADKVVGFRLDIGAVGAQKQRAIAAHRSQVAPGVFTDDPAGFLLSEEILAHFSSPYEVFFETLSSWIRTSPTRYRRNTSTRFIRPTGTRGTSKAVRTSGKSTRRLWRRCPARITRRLLRLAAHWAC